MADNNQSIQLIPALTLQEDNTINDSLKLIEDRYGTILIVLDQAGKLSGIVSPGDLRKAILQGHSVRTRLDRVINRNPVYIRYDEIKSATDVNQGIMDALRGRYSEVSMMYALLPVITSDRKVMGLISLDSLTGYVATPQVRINHRTVLIVGGAGYIGSVLTRKLLADGWAVKILDRLLYGEESLRGLEGQNMILKRGDASVIDDIVNAVDGVDAVVYLAELVGDPACSAAPQAALKTNYLAVTSMAHLCSHLNINRFIYTSSCSVYGANPDAGMLLTEDSSVQPVSLYGRMKALVEQAILSVCNLPNPMFSPTILRLATVFGHSYRPRFDLVVNTFVKNALQKGAIEIFGGEQWRPNVHVTDVAEAIVRVLDAPPEKIRGQIFNVGGNDLNYTINELADFTEEIFPYIKIIRKNGAKDLRNYRVDFGKIRKFLKFEPRIDVKQGMLEIKQAFDRQDYDNLDDPRYSNIAMLRELNLV